MNFKVITNKLNATVRSIDSTTQTYLLTCLRDNSLRPWTPPYESLSVYREDSKFWQCRFHFVKTAPFCWHHIEDTIRQFLH
jgi:hypothetical protein